jgi:hypothetical protein
MSNILLVTVAKTESQAVLKTCSEASGRPGGALTTIHKAIEDLHPAVEEVLPGAL